ncbi:magnesium transporter [Ensifer adhaerens]|uniref:Magnesium transport protein CorA n=1 Tax=Ensifer adhaerens TaxID=106592 RepID=A0A0L8BN12_ENSAD|nr:magnesium transporter CorA family protein [Ensifer adhaerens]KOF15968.1 magnesium transporter [Ensifer adhaerens]
MITGYCSNGETVILSVADEPVTLRPDIVWVDLVEPSKAEDLMMEKLLGISIPTRDDLKDIEPSSRLYTEADAVFMTASLVYRSETDIPDLTDVAFILHGGRLVTIRYAEPRAFALFKAAMHRIPGGCPNGVVMLTRLLETIADRTAEILEQAVGKIDDLSLQVFGEKAVVKRRPPHFLEARLRDVAGHHRLVAKTRDSLSSLSRLLTFVYTVPDVQADKDSRELCRSISRDIQTLSEHASFISGNITFLLDASLGLINVEQNAIIKIFSIAAVVLLPPTLVASVYGMNFRVMPELEWQFGYPWALAAMVISAVIPFFFFRWKGWL